MGDWSATKASRVLSALKRIGRTVSRQTGSHRVLVRPGWPNQLWAFHDGAEVGPKMLARIGKETGLKPSDL